MSLSGANILCIFRTSLEKIIFFNNECKKMEKLIFSSPGELLPSLGVHRTSKVSSFKIGSVDAGHQSIWLLLLKIEHMVKLQVLG